MVEFLAGTIAVILVLAGIYVVYRLVQFEITNSRLNQATLDYYSNRKVASTLKTNKDLNKMLQDKAMYNTVVSSESTTLTKRKPNPFTVTDLYVVDGHGGITRVTLDRVEYKDA